MMYILGKMSFVFFVSGIFLLSGCTSNSNIKKNSLGFVGVHPEELKKTEGTQKETIVFTKDYYADYRKNFVIYKPPKWTWGKDFLNVAFWKPSLIRFMLVNSETEGIIVLRYGQKAEFGISAMSELYGLDESELIYLTKLIKEGDYIKQEAEFKTKSTCFIKPRMFLYKVKFNNASYKLAVFAAINPDLFYLELLTPDIDFKKDFSTFLELIDNISKTENLRK